MFDLQDALRRRDVKDLETRFGPDWMEKVYEAAYDEGYEAGYDRAEQNELAEYGN